MKKKTSSYWAVGGLVALALGSGAFVTSETGCNSAEPTALFLGVSSDMIVADDFDSVGLFVSVRGEVKFSRVVPVSPTGTVTLPASLSITQPSDRTTPVHIRVAGYKAGAVVAVRDAISTVPDNQISVLRLPLQWLSTQGTKGRQAGATAATGTLPMNAGNVRIRADLPADDISFSEFSPFFTDLVLPCPAGQTSIAGACADAHIDPKDLFPSNGGAHLGQVYGGAVGTEGATVVGGACFGVDECFADAPALRAEDLDLTTCTVRKSSNPAGDVSLINFGLKRKSADCTNQKCVVPLDFETPTVIKNGGWRESNGAAVLPPAVCERLKDGSLEAVLVSSTCDHKVASIPTCGPWSSVKTEVAKQRSSNGYYGGSSVVDAGPDSSRDASDGGAGGGPVVRLPSDKLVFPIRMSYDAAEHMLWVKGKTGTVGFDPTAPTDLKRVQQDLLATEWGSVSAARNRVAMNTREKAVLRQADLSESLLGPGTNRVFHGSAMTAYDYGVFAENDGSSAWLRFLNTQPPYTQRAFNIGSATIGDIFVREDPVLSKSYVYVTLGAQLVKYELPATYAELPGSVVGPIAVGPGNAVYSLASVGSIYSSPEAAFHFQASELDQTFALLRFNFSGTSSEVFSGPLNLSELVELSDGTSMTDRTHRPGVASDGVGVYFSDGYAVYARRVDDAAATVAPKPIVPKGTAHIYALALSETELFWADETGAVYKMAKPIK